MRKHVLVAALALVVGCRKEPAAGGAAPGPAPASAPAASGSSTSATRAAGSGGPVEVEAAVASAAAAFEAYMIHFVAVSKAYDGKDCDAFVAQVKTLEPKLAAFTSIVTSLGSDPANEPKLRAAIEPVYDRLKGQVDGPDLGARFETAVKACEAHPELMPGARARHDAQEALTARTGRRALLTVMARPAGSLQRARAPVQLGPARGQIRDVSLDLGTCGREGGGDRLARRLW